MITYLKGDLFSSPAKILVNTVNVVGVMGKGVALEFKKRFPEMFSSYQLLCKEGKLNIGNLYLWRKEEKWVLLFPTKEDWRKPSKLEYIEEGLSKFASHWDALGVDSIAFPRLGCGNGGLDWNDVRPLMEKYLNPLPMQIYIYVDKYLEPKPEHLEVSEMEKWLSGEYTFEGYEKFKYKAKDFLNISNNIVLLENGLTNKVIIQDDIIIVNNVMEITDEEACSLWNYIRDVGVTLKNEIPHEFQAFSDIVFALMKKLRYIETVIVSKNGVEFEKSGNAYQYIAD